MLTVVGPSDGTFSCARGPTRPRASNEEIPLVSQSAPPMVVRRSSTGYASLPGEDDRGTLRILRSCDAYAHPSREASAFVEPTATGGIFTIIVAGIVAGLFYLQVSTLMSTQFVQDIVVARDSVDMTLPVNVRIDFPNVGCELLSLDVVDALHSRRMDITGDNIYKHPLNGPLRFMNLEHASPTLVDVGQHELGTTTDFDHYGNRRIAYDIVGVEAFERMVKIHASGLLMVNFHAPWCSHCREFAPIWEHASEMVRLEIRRIGKPRLALGLASVDCTIEGNDDLCAKLHIQAYPAIRVYRAGSLHPSRENQTSLEERTDDIQFEVYHGKRSAEAIATFAESLLKEVEAGLEGGDSGSNPQRRPLVIGHDFDGDGLRDSTVRSPGCSINGQFSINRVPGAFYFHPRSRSHTIGDVDMTHVVKHLSFGTHAPGGPRRFVPRHLRKAWKLIPKDAGGRFAGKLSKPMQFDADNSGRTVFDHYVNVIPRTYHPVGDEPIHIYEYTFSSHAFKLRDDAAERELSRNYRTGGEIDREFGADEFRRPDGPSIRFSYDISAMGVVTREVHKNLLEWILGCSAILGGLVTCSVGLERFVYASSRAVKRRIGKRD